MSADFGHAGNLTVRKKKGFIQLSLSQDEHLHYKLKVRGQRAIFNLLCDGTLLWDDSAYPAGTAQFERTWPRSAAELGNNPADLSLEMAFATASSYTLVVEIQDRNHRVVSTVVDIDCSSDDGRDSYPSVILVQKV
jgi:hypothetical protein